MSIKSKRLRQEELEEKTADYNPQLDDTSVYQEYLEDVIGGAQSPTNDENGYSDEYSIWSA